MRFSPKVASEGNDGRPTTSSFSCSTGGVDFVYGNSSFDFSVQAPHVMDGSSQDLVARYSDQTSRCAGLPALWC